MNRIPLHITTCILFVFAVLTVSVSDTANAMNWPSDNAVLVRNFGSNDRGKPVMGMTFNEPAEGTEIFTAESGEIIFVSDSRNTASRLPTPLGSWTAVDHGDGLISIYSRYSDEPNVFQDIKEVEKQQPVAVSGTSGWSVQNGFYFMIFDRRERRWINPAMIITPMLETRPPQINSVDLRNAQGQLMQLRNLTQGRYTVIVNAAGGTARTTPVNVQPFAPHRIVSSVNGAEVGLLNFEAVSARDGILMVSRNGLVPARQIYNSFPAFEAAEVFLARGQVTLEVIVQDITGTSRSIIHRLIVN